LAINDIVDAKAIRSPVSYLLAGISKNQSSHKVFIAVEVAKIS